MTTQLALQKPTIYDGETRLGSISFVGLLDEGEKLSGTPTVEDIVTPSDLTITNVSIGTAAKTINKKLVAANKYVLCKIVGQVAGTTYTVEAPGGTNSSPAQTLKIKASFTTED